MVDQNNSSLPIIEFPENLKESINICLSHSKDLLETSKREVDCVPNIAFHLATLSLEEIGKAELLMSNFAAKLEENEYASSENKMDDHIRKLFFALWGPYFSKNSITKETVRKLEGVAKNLHLNRIKGLYVEVKEEVATIHPRNTIRPEDTKNLISLVSSILINWDIEKRTKIPEEYQEDLRWFLNATKDPFKRNVIYSSKSLNELSHSENPY